MLGLHVGESLSTLKMHLPSAHARRLWATNPQGWSPSCFPSLCPVRAEWMNLG